MTRNTFRPLAIVVVNYASHELLGQNLAAVAEGTPDADVVVVDSFSGAAEQQAVTALAAGHGWHVVTTEENVGFGVGMNLGVAAARARGAEAFLLLNPDAVIPAESLATLRAELEKSPLTLLAPTIYDAGGRVWFDGADVDLDSGETRSVHRRTGNERVHPWLTGPACWWAWNCGSSWTVLTTVTSCTGRTWTCPSACAGPGELSVWWPGPRPSMMKAAPIRERRAPARPGPNRIFTITTTSATGCCSRHSTCPMTIAFGGGGVPAERRIKSSCAGAGANSCARQDRWVRA
ncbi:glycosyltransferase family 2 protein [Arthrobacter sp. ERGS1:01]|uniref:glycosyltransferase family 2 protein n=1 Tax=Arthrobacter sp. ERGS1:01 TaxID=1704044 RepID=UPI0009E8FB93|nr:glycosyltransferase [Arthrobacter sp. ERGS1:01]